MTQKKKRLASRSACLILLTLSSRDAPARDLALREAVRLKFRCTLKISCKFLVPSCKPKSEETSNAVIPTKLLVKIMLLLLHCSNQERRTDLRSGTKNRFFSENGEPLNGELASIALSYPQPAAPDPGLLLSLTTCIL